MPPAIRTADRSPGLNLSFPGRLRAFVFLNLKPAPPRVVRFMQPVTGVGKEFRTRLLLKQKDS